MWISNLIIYFHLQLQLFHVKQLFFLFIKTEYYFYKNVSRETFNKLKKIEIIIEIILVNITVEIIREIVVGITLIVKEIVETKTLEK